MEKFILHLLFFQSIILNGKQKVNNKEHSIGYLQKVNMGKKGLKEGKILIGRDMGF